MASSRSGLEAAHAGRRVSALGAAAVAALAGISGCHQATKTAAPPVASTTPSETRTTLTVPSASTPTVAPSPSPTAAPAAVLPAGCPQLLSLPSVEQAIGAGLLGEVTYLKAAPVPQSGRTGRVTCGYGVPVHTPSPVGTRQAAPTPVAGAQPLLSASYITYVDEKTAAGRVALTVQADGVGAVVTTVTVDGLPASVLVGAKGSELVMSGGARTIVLVASPAILTAAKAPAALEAMAAIMLRFGAPASSAGASAVASGAASPVASAVAS
jgi:hypothetical protein